MVWTFDGAMSSDGTATGQPGRLSREGRRSIPGQRARQGKSRSAIWMLASLSGNAWKGKKKADPRLTGHLIHSTICSVQQFIFDNKSDLIIVKNLTIFLAPKDKHIGADLVDYSGNSTRGIIDYVYGMI